MIGIFHKILVWYCDTCLSICSYSTYLNIKNTYFMHQFNIITQFNFNKFIIIYEQKNCIVLYVLYFTKYNMIFIKRRS